LFLGGTPLWKFLDFVVTVRMPLFVMLKPFIQFKVQISLLLKFAINLFRPVRIWTNLRVNLISCELYSRKVCEIIKLLLSNNSYLYLRDAMLAQF